MIGWLVYYRLANKGVILYCGAMDIMLSQGRINAADIFIIEKQKWDFLERHGRHRENKNALALNKGFERYAVV